MNGLLGFLAPFIDNAAHLGGLLSGITLGAFFTPAEAALRLLSAPASTGAAEAPPPTVPR